MNWEALGAIGEIVGAVAVVVTLAYLAVQMRQNTVALQAASRQEVASAYRDSNRLFFEPGAARAYARGLRLYPDMPLDEKNLFWAFLNDGALAFQGAYAMHEAGQLEDETYQAYLDWFAANLSTPGGSAWWEEIGRPIYVKRMVHAVDARLARKNLPDVLELGILGLDDLPVADRGAGETGSEA